MKDEEINNWVDNRVRMIVILLDAHEYFVDIDSELSFKTEVFASALANEIISYKDIVMQSKYAASNEENIWQAILELNSVYVDLTQKTTLIK